MFTPFAKILTNFCSTGWIIDYDVEKLQLVNKLSIEIMQLEPQ
jgi:hypothetical protein